MDTEKSQNCQVEIIAHRGASFIAPENTLSSVRLGWEMGADGVEIDIRLTTDGRIVCMHDPDTSRITGKAFTISETSAETLRTLDAGIMKPEVFAGEHIPFLEEIICDIPDSRTLYIEIKCGSEIIPPLEKIIEESGNRDRIAFKGFDIDTLSTVKEQFRSIPAYWLVELIRNGKTEDRSDLDSDMIVTAVEKGFSGISMNSDGITADFAESAISSGLRLFAWTINDPDDAKRLVSYGVHGLVTDRPRWLREALTT